MQVTVKRLLRWPAVLEATGRSRASIHNDIKAGLFPPPVRIAANSVAYPDVELAAIIDAKIRGASPDEIRALVRRLIAARTQTEPEAA